MSTHAYRKKEFNEAQDVYVYPTDDHKYEYLDLGAKYLDTRQGVPTSRPGTSAAREAPTSIVNNSTPRQSSCTSPPWWAWLIIVIGVVLIVAAATAIYFFTRSGPAAMLAANSISPSIPMPEDVTDCSEADTSGIYTVVSFGLNIRVYCQVDDEGKFVVIQRRKDGSVNFYRNWADYRQGFGNLSGEFWLGNDNIHALTTAGYTRLRIDLQDWNNTKYTVYYNSFWVAAEENKYKLTVSAFVGSDPPGDSFSPHHDDKKFSTYDEDNDVDKYNCASVYLGGWWYESCHTAHLNGVYNNTEFGRGINWKAWKGYNYSLKQTMMMLSRT